MIQTEEVIWCFRMLLGRDPESDAAIRHHAEHANPPNREGLRAMVMQSGEFTDVLGRAGMKVERDGIPAALVAPFLSITADAGESGFYRDRFGIWTRCHFLPESYEKYSGHVAKSALDTGMPLHDDAEFVAMLRSANEARGSFTVVELGAGWGPWLVLGAKLAQRRGLPFRLVGVEASPEHCAFMRAHFLDNGLNPNEHVLLHSAVGAEDGEVTFPELPDPRSDWGAKVSTAASGSAPAVTVPSVSVATLLAGFDHVDLVHFDIQGLEAEAIASSVETMKLKVKRIVIGTHSRDIEAQLFDLLSHDAWHLEHDQACLMRQGPNGMELAADGTQVWTNKLLRR